MKIKIGDYVYWKPKRGMIITGKVFKKNPSIAPGAKYGIKVRGGDTFYPICKVHKLNRRKR